MNSNQAFSMPAAYGQAGVRLVVEGGDKIRVWADSKGSKAEVELGLTVHQALALAANLLSDADQDELSQQVAKLAGEALRRQRAEA
jgi:hypothetical protein